MNGRIYDPLLGRFLSADILVQAPGNLQSFNRYSYVMNNPLTLVDPSGFTSRETKARLAGVADVLIADTIGAVTFVVGFVGDAGDVKTASAGSEFVSGAIKDGITSLTGIPQNDPDRQIGQGVTELATIAYAGAKILTAFSKTTATVADDAASQTAKQVDTTPTPKVETVSPVAEVGDTISTTPPLETANPRNLVSRQGPSEMTNNQVKRLTKDMKENGFDADHPIEVANVDGKKVIIDGHHRTEAAKAAGIGEVPIKTTTVTEAEVAKLAEEAAAAAEERARLRR